MTGNLGAWCLAFADAGNESCVKLQFPIDWKLWSEFLSDLGGFCNLFAFWGYGRTLGGEAGNAIETIILASSVLYELIGPACAKLSLYFSKSYSSNIDEIVPPEALPEMPKNAVELLIEQIQTIQKELPSHTDCLTDNEQVFLEAAEQQYIVPGRLHSSIHR